MEEKSAVEAALFAASEPLTAQEISAHTGIEVSTVRYAIKDLRMEYEMRDSAIIIAAIEGKYRMQLRKEYQKYSGIVTAPEFNAGVMRTLSTIAYNQPVLQSKIVKARGPRGYADIATLIEAGYVSSKPSGQSLSLTTTAKFSEDFGIGSMNHADIRKWIENNSNGMVARRSKAAPAAPAAEAPEAGESSGSEDPVQ